MKETEAHSPHSTGTQVNYYFVCHRKLWLFSRGIQMEHESDTVFQGKLVGEESYDRRRKEIDIAGTIVLDGFDASRGVIYEVKKSRAVEKAHTWQMKYYLYFLKQLGVSATGEMDYPLLKRREICILNSDDEVEMRVILKSIDTLVRQSAIPGVKKKSFCRKCAYYEFCWE